MRLVVLATDQGVVRAGWGEDGWYEAERIQMPRETVCIAAHGSHVLAGTTSGMLYSEDMGQTWRLVSDGLTDEYVNQVAYHPQFPSFAFAGTRPAQIWISRDAGKVWEKSRGVSKVGRRYSWNLSRSPRASRICGFTFQGSRGYAAVESGGVLRSNNRGESWWLVKGSTGDPQSQVPDNFVHPNVHAVVLHPASEDLVFAATGGGLYRSQNGGDSWTLLHPAYSQAVWVDPADPDHVILSLAEARDEQGRLEQSLDGGQSWKPADRGLNMPWEHYMVQRFAYVEHHLLGVVSNGHLIATPLPEISWQRVLPEVPGVNAVARIVY